MLRICSPSPNFLAMSLESSLKACDLQQFRDRIPINQAVTCSKDHTPVCKPAHAKWLQHYSKPSWVVPSACLSKLCSNPQNLGNTSKHISPQGAPRCFQKAFSRQQSIYWPCGTCRFMRTSSLVLSQYDVHTFQNQQQCL